MELTVSTCPLFAAKSFLRNSKSVLQTRCGRSRLAHIRVADGVVGTKFDSFRRCIHDDGIADDDPSNPQLRDQPGGVEVTRCSRFQWDVIRLSVMRSISAFPFELFQTSLCGNFIHSYCGKSSSLNRLTCMWHFMTSSDLSFQSKDIKITPKTSIDDGWVCFKCIDVLIMREIRTYYTTT
jgi:hypothetical protein